MWLFSITSQIKTWPRWRHHRPAQILRNDLENRVSLHRHFHLRRPRPSCWTTFRRRKPLQPQDSWTGRDKALSRMRDYTTGNKLLLQIPSNVIEVVIHNFGLALIILDETLKKTWIIIQVIFVNKQNEITNMAMMMGDLMLNFYAVSVVHNLFWAYGALLLN